MSILPNSMNYLSILYAVALRIVHIMNVLVIVEAGCLPYTK